MVSQKQKICEHWWSQYCVHIVKVVSILNSGNQDTYLFIKPGKSDWDKSWDIDIKIRGKIVGHWYQKFDGVPLSPYCVYCIDSLLTCMSSLRPTPATRPESGISRAAMRFSCAIWSPRDTPSSCRLTLSSDWCSSRHSADDLMTITLIGVTLASITLPAQ